MESPYLQRRDFSWNGILIFQSITEEIILLMTYTGTFCFLRKTPEYFAGWQINIIRSFTIKDKPQRNFCWKALEFYMYFTDLRFSFFAFIHSIILVCHPPSSCDDCPRHRYAIFTQLMEITMRICNVAAGRDQPTLAVLCEVVIYFDHFRVERSIMSK